MVGARRTTRHLARGGPHERSSPTGSCRWSASAVLVAALVLGAGSLKALSRQRRPEPDARRRTGRRPPPPTGGHRPRPRPDRPPTTSPPASPPASPPTAPGPEVLYGVRQHRLGGSSAVLVLRNAAGDVRLCDQFGADAPSQAPLPTPRPQRAGRVPLHRPRPPGPATAPPGPRPLRAVHLAGGLPRRRDGPSSGSGSTASPGPWFETRAHGGYAHLQTWLAGPRARGTTYAEQFRVLDADGTAVPQTALPTGSSALPGCRAGGSAQIG